MFPPCKPRRGGMAQPDTLVWKSRSSPMRLSPEEGRGIYVLQGPFNNRSEMTAQDVMWRDLLHWRMMERELAKPFPHHLLLKHLTFAKILQLSAEASPQCCFSLIEGAEDPAGLKIRLDPSAFPRDHSRSAIIGALYRARVLVLLPKDTEPQHVLCHTWAHWNVRGMQNMVYKIWFNNTWKINICSSPLISLKRNKRIPRPPGPVHPLLVSALRCQIISLGQMSPGLAMLWWNKTAKGRTLLLDHIHVIFAPIIDGNKSVVILNLCGWGQVYPSRKTITDRPVTIFSAED